MIIDDLIPVDSKNNPLFLLSVNDNWAPLLIEKAYIKKINIFYHLEDESTFDDRGIPVHYALEILYTLTGFVCNKVKTKYQDPNKLARRLKELKEFKVRIAYPN